ncbi:hypothetical protein TYRP_006150 [Tyrophagus putrescentiae]|nr:hypothetical protein TYRP_006150 [Tyrophagus putrescentiae]
MARGRRGSSAAGARGARGGASTSRVSTVVDEVVTFGASTSTRRTSSRVSKASTSAATAAAASPSTSRGRGRGRKTSATATSTSKSNAASTAAVDEVNSSMFFEQLITIDDSPPPAPPGRRQLSKGKEKGSSDYLKRVMSEADDLLLSTPSPPPPQKDMGAQLFTNSNKKALTSNGAPIAPDLSKPSTSAAASADFKTPSSIRVRPPAAETAAAAAATTTTEPQQQQSSTAAGAEPVRSSTSQLIANNIFNMVDFVDNASPIRALRNNYMRGAADRDDESEGGDMSSQAIEAGSSFADTAPVDRSLITEQDSAVHDQSTTVAEDGQGEGTPVIKQKSGAGKSSTDHRHAAAAAAALPDDHMLDELQHFNWAANEGHIRSGPSTNKTPSPPKRMKLADQQADHQSAAAFSHRDSLKRVDLRPRFEESLSTMELSKEDGGGVVVVVASAPALPTGIGGGGGGAHQPPPPSPFTSLPTSMDGFSRQLAARASLRQQQQTPMQSTPLVPSRAQSRTNRLSSLAAPADSLQNAPPAANLLDDIDWEDLGEDLIIDEDKAKEAKAAEPVVNRSSTPPPPAPPPATEPVAVAPQAKGEKEERKSSGDFVFDDDEDFEALVNTMLEAKEEQPATAAASTAAEAAAAAAPAADINYDDLLSDDLEDFEPLEDQVVVPTATTTSTTTAINPPAVAEAMKVDSSKSATVAPAAKDVDEEFAFDDDDDDFYALAIPSYCRCTGDNNNNNTTAAIPVADDFDYDSLLDDDLDLESWPLPSTSAASAQPPPEPPEPPLANPFLLPQPETLALRRPKAKPRSRKDLFGKLTTLNDIRKMLRLNGFMDEQKEAAGEGEGEGDGRPGQ